MCCEAAWKTLAIVTALTFATVACDGDAPTGVENGVPGVETAVVVNSMDLSVTVFPVDSPQMARAIGLAQAGSPVSVAVRQGRAVVPLGLLSAAAVIDLAIGDVHTIPLPENSGATGVAFFNDSIAYVANPGLNTVSPINVFDGTAADEIAVGIYPQGVTATSDRVLVLNAELDETFRPVRTGAISVVDPTSNTEVSAILLSGFNPSVAAFGPDGLLYVVNSGTFGQGDGSLSVVDASTLSEVEHHAGFGEFPGDIAFSPVGHAYVSSFSYGIAVWDTEADTFIRPPSDPLRLQGSSTVSGVGFDSQGRLYTLIPGDCTAPSVALRFNPDLSFDREINVGVCPIAIAFTHVEGP